MDLHHFMAVFNEIVEKKVDDPGGKLTKLISTPQVMQRKWQKIAFSCLLKLDLKLPNDGSLRSMVTLTESNQPKERKSNIGPKLKLVVLMDIEILKFQNFLVKLEHIGYLQSWTVLDTPDIMCMLLLKLPGTARNKWSRNVLTIPKRHKREPDLTDFIHFVNDETLIVSDPIFSKEDQSFIICYTG